MINEETKIEVNTLVNYHRREVKRALLCAIVDTIEVYGMEQEDFDFLDRVEQYVELLGDRTIRRIDKEELDAYTDRMTAGRKHSEAQAGMAPRPPTPIEQFEKLAGCKPEPDVIVGYDRETGFIREPAETPLDQFELARLMPDVRDEPSVKPHLVSAGRTPIDLPTWGGPAQEPETVLTEDDSEPELAEEGATEDAPILNASPAAPDYTTLQVAEKVDREVTRTVNVGRPTGKEFN